MSALLYLDIFKLCFECSKTFFLILILKRQLLFWKWNEINQLVWRGYYAYAWWIDGADLEDINQTIIWFERI